MSRYLDSKFAALEPYVPGEQPKDRPYIKLNANESPYPPSPLVLEALRSAEAGALNLYPDAACRELTELLAKHLGVGEGTFSSQTARTTSSTSASSPSASAEWCSRTSAMAFTRSLRTSTT